MQTEIDTMKKNIGMLRQWLNEDRITDPKKMVTNEQIERWLNQSGDIAPNNKIRQHDESQIDVSPDWVDTILKLAHDSGYQEGRQETILEMVGQHFMLPEERASKMVEQIRQEERERIVKLIEEIVIKDMRGESHWGWNQALEELKEKI